VTQFFPAVPEMLEPYTTKENVFGFVLGFSDLADKREMMTSTHFYLNEAFPQEMQVFRENLKATLKKQTPDEAAATLKNVEASFMNIAQAWATVAAATAQLSTGAGAGDQK
jgi:hypothetical protein